MSVHYLSPLQREFNFGDTSEQSSFDSFLQHFRQRYGASLAYVAKRENSKFFTHTREWKTFRLALIAHRGSHCSLCRAENSAVEVHHIQERNRRPDLAFDPSNCVVLCRTCHDGVHLLRRDFDLCSCSGSS